MGRHLRAHPSTHVSSTQQVRTSRSPSFPEEELTMSTTPQGNLWLRVHIDFMDHPKFIDLDNDSIVLWLSAMSYSKRFLTDGVVPVSKIRSLSGAKRWRKCVENLVNRDIFHWDFDQKNIIIHDFVKSLAYVV